MNDTKPTMESLSYQLQKKPAGVVMLDPRGYIQSASPLARQVLERYHPEILGRSVVELHPPPARPKLAWLLQEAASSDVVNPTPVSMTIHTPDQPLLLSLTRLEGPLGTSGFCLLFYDLQALDAPAEDEGPVPGAGRLIKIPVQAGRGTMLVAPEEVVHLQAEGHYARLFTAAGSHLSHLSLAQLEQRLDGRQFLRIHRRHLIAIAHAAGLEKEGGRQWVVMATTPGCRLPIGRRRAAAVALRLGV